MTMAMARRPVSSGAMDQVIEHAAGDLVVRVQALALHGWYQGLIKVARIHAHIDILRVANEVTL